MTLRDALDALHRAGRIRSPVLPGMWTDYHVRVLDDQNDGFPRLIRVIDDERASAWVDRDEGGEPDSSDPATVGCLAALAREADGRAGLFAAYISEPPEVWEVVSWDPEIGTADAWPGSPARGLTEGEAWAAALVAMAEALP